MLALAVVIGLLLVIWEIISPQVVLEKELSKEVINLNLVFVLTNCTTFSHKFEKTKSVPKHFDGMLTFILRNVTSHDIKFHYISVIRMSLIRF